MLDVVLTPSRIMYPVEQACQVPEQGTRFLNNLRLVPHVLASCLIKGTKPHFTSLSFTGQRLSAARTAASNTRCVS